MCTTISPRRKLHSYCLLPLLPVAPSLFYLVALSIIARHPCTLFYHPIKNVVRRDRLYLLSTNVLLKNVVLVVQM